MRRKADVTITIEARETGERLRLALYRDLAGRYEVRRSDRRLRMPAATLSTITAEARKWLTARS